jgi:ElaB/YqjD/DUF883 family membrane-anchored ribosome-binding protein
MGDYAHRAGDRVRDRYTRAADDAREQVERAKEFARQNPLGAMATAFGVGLVAGLFVAASLRSR